MTFKSIALLIRHKICLTIILAILDYRDQILGQFYCIIVITILLSQYYTPPKPHFSTRIPIICQINIRWK